jgi:predicted nucleic acid-binding protein
VRSELAAPKAKALVLDANILVRAVLGRRVIDILENHVSSVHFLAPESSFTDVKRHLPNILLKRGLPKKVVERLVEDEILNRLPRLVTPVPQGVCATMEVEARLRLSGRDETDWPILALALTLGCPIWTEDKDFFGSGVATWTTDRVEVYLASKD